MRIGLLTTAFPRWTNDSRGPSMMETARALQACGVEVQVITLHGPGAKRNEVMEGIAVHRARYLWPDTLERLQDVGGGLPAAWKQDLLYKLAFGPLFLGLVWATIRHGGQCDVIHAHWTLAGLAAWLASFVTGRPFVLTVHGSDIFVAPGIPGVAAVTRAMLRRCAHVIAVSRALADATATLGIARGSIEVIPDGIDIERFTPGPAEREPILLFVGSLIKRKGVHDLLEALALARSELVDARLVIAGDGPERAALERQTQDLNLGAQVTFVGPQSQTQIADWQRRARVFVLPSLEEALGIVLLEALASGTPCVATRVGGIPDVVTPDVGLLVPPADPRALADALIALWRDPAGWRARHLRARPHVEQNCYTWHKVAARLAVIYATIDGRP